MLGSLNISLASKSLSSGTAEERATFGLLSIAANGRLLTEGARIGGRPVLRDGPYVSGYPLAEWLVWNWWRLRWESARPSAEDARNHWDFAHRMTTVGDGYVWPDITVCYDGPQAVLVSRPSAASEKDMFRYLGPARREAIPAGDLEDAINDFVSIVMNRLRRRQLCNTNLHRLWNELTEERNDPELSRFRRMEAQLGCDPDEADERIVRRCLDDAVVLGDHAWGEIAADIAFRGETADRIASAEDFRGIARISGFEADARDAVDLDAASESPPLAVAWELGEAAARALRHREGLDGQALPDRRLAAFAGAPADTVSRTNRRGNDLPFALDGEGNTTRIVLRSKWETGRRFELARLIGDRLLASNIVPENEALFPATRSYSYRQRAQRAFAAELLSPFHAVDEMLSGDYSEERQSEVAEHFEVSPMTVRTQLVNRKRLDLDDAPDIAGRGATA